MDPDDQGVKASQYSIIPRTLIFITKDDCILLLKGAPHKRLWANKYNGIGGHIEPGETPLQSARRELHEETGIRVPRLDLRAVIHITMPQPPGIMLFVFVGQTGSPGPTLRSSAEGTPEWIPLSEYEKLDLVEDLYVLLPRILQPGPLLFASYKLGAEGLEIKWDTDATPELRPEKSDA